MANGHSNTDQQPGVRHDPYMVFNFVFEVDNLEVGGFSDVTGLQVETSVEDYREGGQNEYLHKLAGPCRYPANLVLKHGLFESDTLWEWQQKIRQGTIVRKNCTLVMQNQQGQPVVEWHIRGAYPVKWSGPELSATTNAIAVESLELVHQGIIRKKPPQEKTA